MDGNGRWAKQRMLPRVAGHRRGVEAVRAIILACIERDIEFLTLFAFSSENWRRPADEVSILMDLFLHALEQEVAKLHANGIRFKVIGDTSMFDSRIRDLIAAGEAQTAAHRRLTLTVAANYGGRWDIAQAVRKFVAAHPEMRADATLLTPEALDPIWRWPTRPSPTCSSARAASSASRTSCSGSSLTRSSISPTCCGPTSTPSR
jgi:undecaprenyl diphosphate synthase